MKTIMAHADLDAFYASVEQLDNPLYKGKPVIVGGSPRGRGVVSTASYEARKFGIHSAMPTATAHRLCPQGIFLKTRFQRYRELSIKFKAILRSLTPKIEPISMDEAFLDLTENTLKSKDPYFLGRYIQKRVYNEIGLWVSLGLAPNKLLAKMASDLDKPKGMLVVEHDQIQDFLFPQPVAKLWGVGKKMNQKLEKLNIKTIEDLYNQNENELISHFGHFGRRLYQMARGLDTRPVSTSRESKSLGAERTFSSDVDQLKELERYLFSICLEVAKRAKSKKIMAKTITLKYKNNQFESRTKSQTIDKFINNEDDLFHYGSSLLNKISLESPLRLIGISLSNFQTSEKDSTQLSLF